MTIDQEMQQPRTNSHGLTDRHREGGSREKSYRQKGGKKKKKRKDKTKVEIRQNE
jgi:hypothetical protein